MQLSFLSRVLNVETDTDYLPLGRWMSSNREWDWRQRMTLMNTKWTFNQVSYSLLLLAGGVALATSAARAQDAPPNDPNYNQNSDMQSNGDQSNYDGPENGQDPPTRVARLSFVDGSSSFQPAGPAH